MSKRTPFYNFHKELGAKIVDFAGFEMPVQYTSIIEEHMKVRDSVGVFDISHMGNFIVSGNNALDFLQKTTINDVSKLKIGKVQYSAMCYENGGIIDDLLVYRRDNGYFLVVNASNIDKDFDWLARQKTGNVELNNKSDLTAALAIQGPKSLATLQKLTKEDLARFEYYTFVSADLAGLPMIISRTGYTGELGFELYFESSSQNAEKIWKSVFEAGKEFGILPVGLGARDTLRLEMGYCLYGNDIDKDTQPLEAGLGWITKLDKGDFIGRDEILKSKNAGLKRRLVGFTLPDRTLARHGYDVTCNGKAAGKVTSGTFSPSLQKGIGMGYVTADLAKPGTVVQISVRDKMVPATIVKPPFVKNHSMGGIL
jgi:aminomethyltransferase